MQAEAPNPGLNLGLLGLWTDLQRKGHTVLSSEAVVSGVWEIRIALLGGGLDSVQSYETASER